MESLYPRAPAEQATHPHAREHAAFIHRPLGPGVCHCLRSWILFTCDFGQSEIRDKPDGASTSSCRLQGKPASIENIDGEAEKDPNRWGRQEEEGTERRGPDGSRRRKGKTRRGEVRNY